MAINKRVKNLYIQNTAYFPPSGGDITADGCIKLAKNGNDLVIWRLVSGTWEEIWRYTA